MRIGLIFFAVIVLLSGQLKAVDDRGANKLIDNKHLDSIDIQIELALRNKDNVQTMQLLNKKGRILFEKGLYSNSIAVLNNAIKLSNDGNDTIKYPEMRYLYMDLLSQQGLAYSYLAKYEDAINCYIAMDKYNKRSDPLYKAMFYNGMGVVFSMSSKLDYARNYYLKALKVTETLKDDEQNYMRLFTMNYNLSGLFILKSNFDSAQIYAVDAQRLAILMKDKEKDVSCFNLLGYLNKSAKKYELAINYYNEACKLITDSKNYYLLPFIKTSMAECYIKLGNRDEAFKLSNEALDIARKSKIKRVEIGALSIISSLYKERGDYRNSLDYIEESNRIKDSLFSQENDDKLLRQKTDFDMYKLMMDKDMFDKNAELQRSKEIVSKLVATILLILFVITLFFLTYRLISQNKKNKIKSQKYTDDISSLMDRSKLLEDEIKQKSEEISINSLLLTKHNKLSTLLMSKLKRLKTDLSDKVKVHEDIEEIDDLLTQLSQSSYIGELNTFLERVEMAFFDKLDILYPDMTMGEKKICALLSLGLSTKDIANLTGKSRGAIDIIKFRIRKKINVDTDVDLESFFFQIRV